LQVLSTPGDHWTRYLHGKELAKQLLACLEPAQAAGAGGVAANHRRPPTQKQQWATN
jgi:hypothetical protein